MDGRFVSEHCKPLILAVDDDPVVKEGLFFSLEDEFLLEVVGSAEAGLAAFRELNPSLVLMDIGLPGMDGYEACRQIKELADVPVLFLSSCEDLEDRLKAYDVGGCDFITKPFDPPILLRKVQLAILQKAERERLVSEKADLQKTAMNFLTDVAQSRMLLDFLRTSMACGEYDELARNLLATTADYGLQCHVRIRPPSLEPVSMTASGVATALESSVLDQVQSLGRLFRFKRRLVVNFDYVTILVHDLPEDELSIGRIQDNLVILAEGAEAIAETIGVRKISASRAETMQIASAEAYESIEAIRKAYFEQQTNTRTLLEGLTYGVESSYYSLGLSEAQETRISDTVRVHAEHILDLFKDASTFEEKFEAILSSLAPSKADNANALF